MNSFLKNARRFFGLAGSFLIVWCAGGCSSPGASPPSSSSSAPATLYGASAPATSAPGGVGDILRAQTAGDVLRVGDPIAISFSGSNAELPPAFTERLKADGMIRLPLIKEPIKAEGKIRGELEEEIRALYVPKIFKNLTVKVASEGRVVHISGEVRIQGRVQVMGKMTVLQAIAAAGGFTDFGNKKKVLITRSNGQKVRVNCVKAIEDSKFDLQVYPDDHIEVPRRLL